MATAAPAVNLWRRSLLGLATVAVMALVLALAAVLDLVDPEVAVEGCAILLVIALTFLVMMRTGFHARFTDAGLVSAQVLAVLLLLAWITVRADDTPSAISVLYLVAMSYGALQLPRARLAALAACALVTHGVAIFVLVDLGGRINHAAAWTQFGALALAFAWLTYAAGTVLRLRERLAEAQRHLQDLDHDAQERARRDALTGVFQHHHLLESLEREVARAQRLGKPLSLARVDLEGLGGINVEYGTAAGDAALKRFVTAAASALRNVDVFGRYGGKEFMVIMPDTDIDGAIVAAERIRAKVAAEPATEARAAGHLRCTLGVAEHAPGGDSRALIAGAESALNYAKAAGRDRVVALGPDGNPVMARAA